MRALPDGRRNNSKLDEFASTNPYQWSSVRKVIYTTGLAVKTAPGSNLARKQGFEAKKEGKEKI